ncbi:MAG: hypothetical protein UR26_C0003G0098 [candidate division TM6 bacterium GW2011_GWF2_32_72]|nr:MAG: hypothetical protein UR26_C0003G0098 [candidate division TM6 bacterium GW2011_GWF2_32_72]
MNKNIKPMILRFFLVIELIVFFSTYFWGHSGIQTLKFLRGQGDLVQIEVDHLRKEVDDLKLEIQAWQTDDFNKEKIAREQLQMARPGDRVYLF